MKILSIDVGIKNLAFCLLVKPDGCEHFQIEKWDTVNLSQLIEELKCSEMDKNNKKCDKPAKFTSPSATAYGDPSLPVASGFGSLQTPSAIASGLGTPQKCFCLKHSKKQPFLIPTADLKTSFINKQKIKTLQEIANKYQISYDPTIKKPELVALINNYILEKCLDPIDKTNASKIDLVTIGRNIQKKMDHIFIENMDTISNVIIENQISPIANRMKTIQGMIAQYFIMRNENIQIDFISSGNKLKDCAPELKSKYSDRKKLSIQLCLDNMSTPNYIDWIPFFNKHSKKDDLADSFLQGLWFINNKV